MDHIAINIALLSVRAFDVLLLTAWIVLLLRAMQHLLKVELTELERILWIIVILLFPVAGACAFLYLHKSAPPTA